MHSEAFTAGAEPVVELDIPRLLLPKKMTIEDFSHLCKVSIEKIREVFVFAHEKELISYEDASEIAGALGIPTLNVVHLPPKISVNYMAKLCGLQANEIIAVLESDHGFKNLQGHKEIQYGIAKEVAKVFGIETRKVLKQAEFDDTNHKLFKNHKEMSILHEFEAHNPDFDMIDTSLVPIFLMQETVTKRIDEYVPIYKIKGISGKKDSGDLIVMTEQIEQHINRMAKRLCIKESALRTTLQTNARPIKHNYDFSLLDTSDIAIYLKKGAADRTRYADNYEHLKKEKAPEDDLDLLIEFLAATSIRTHLKGNVKKAFKEYTIYKKRLAKGDPDAPIRRDTRFHAVKVQLDHIKNRNKLGGRKIQNFAQAMKGDPNAVVVDMWIMRAYKLGSDRSPTRIQYDQIENHIKLIAREIGWQPREVCSAIWGGIRAPFDDETRYEGTISKQRREHVKPEPLPDLRTDQK